MKIIDRNSQIQHPSRSGFLDLASNVPGQPVPTPQLRAAHQEAASKHRDVTLSPRPGPGPGPGFIYSRMRSFNANARNAAPAVLWFLPSSSASSSSHIT
jgi:hypothetical protein